MNSGNETEQARPTSRAAVSLFEKGILAGAVHSQPQQVLRLDKGKLVDEGGQDTVGGPMASHPTLARWHSNEFGVSNEEIDQLGIVPATRLAMQRSLDAALLMPQFLLIDAIKLPSSNIPQKSIVKGDSKCLSIAASSILAKVTRDSLMSGLSEKYPGYGFEKHKGYGTSKHLEEIERLGPCKLHRLTFAPMNKIDQHRF